MSVAELKDELCKLNLPTSGRKKDLIERLTNALPNSEDNTIQEIQDPVLV